MSFRSRCSSLEVKGCPETRPQLPFRDVEGIRHVPTPVGPGIHLAPSWYLGMLRDYRGSANPILRQGKLPASPGLGMTLGPPLSVVYRSSQFKADAATRKTTEAHGLALKSGAPWCPHPSYAGKRRSPVYLDFS